ncbi:LuxR family transcriptional regulator [Mycobacterium sp. 852002-51152_SCH6134967]|uniref:LuxR family transcriptional regulator n=1 Tax=Mycobacterium sp. 852002-51152_SCH6134967 TaxID=1834096 RepID=UPI001E59B544|nr:LuxR family transcriptional regulator [Mycobacterium sp. 852002-51152_SCH6134967]
MSETSWSDVSMGELPTGTVTLLLADVEGSTRLWETQPEAMRTAVERLDRTLGDAVTAHGGVRPVEQGEGDSFVVAFARAADAVACALTLQGAALAPIKLRIGIHTGDVRLRDEGNYIGPTINRAARLRDLAHGGQTVLSGATEPLVVDQLPADITLYDLGSHPLRDLPRPERVVQLCHPDLPNQFPPLRTAHMSNVPAAENLPVQLSSFIGRKTEIRDIREALETNRMVTLTGAGGAGKTRLAIQVAVEIATDFADGVWYVDLAPITDPDVVPVATARALGLPDQPGQPTTDVVLRFVRDRRMLIVLDNCEHLLDATAEMVIALLGASSTLTLLTTSREPIGVTGEVSWRVPSLSLADEALELFSDRARRTKPDFRISAQNSGTVTEICRRLDGLPLAIELAAARVRALSPDEILDSLHDQFRLLTGGARTSVRRQQTLRASVDWSHALLSEPEQTLFRRLAVFFGGFDLDAAHAVAGDDDAERYQVLDQLTLLVDKSLVVADDTGWGTRYRLLETVRQYAQEKLHESREGDVIRARHRDHYSATAALLDRPPDTDHERRVDWAEAEIDNLRAAFAWSREGGDAERALTLASSLQPLWLTRGRIQEGISWLSTALADADVQSCGASPSRVRASANKAMLLAFLATNDNVREVHQVLELARELGDPAQLARALTACGMFAAGDESARQYFTEAAELAQDLGDSWILGQIRAQEALAAFIGDRSAAVVQHAAEEGLRIATDIGDDFVSRQCRFALAWRELMIGDVRGAIRRLTELVDECSANRDAMFSMYTLVVQSYALAYTGELDRALMTAQQALRHASELFDYYKGAVYTAFAHVHLAAGDAPAAWQAREMARALTGVDTRVASTYAWTPLGPVACGDLDAARRCADEVVTQTTGVGRSLALVARAYVKVAAGELGAAERDVDDALDLAVRLGCHLVVPFALEGLASVAAMSGNHLAGARLLGAADAAFDHMGVVRFKVLDSVVGQAADMLREALGEQGFDTARAEGAALSIDEALAYAQRGRGERKRAGSGWESLTRAELDVVKLVSEGLGNKEVAARLFVSPRTVQAHLTHVYTKLGLTSRVQLAQEAAKHR